MSQIEKAPVDRPYGKPLTDRERKKLDVWYEEDGWCSACGRGTRWGKPGPVVHLGSKKQETDVGFCATCVERMHAALLSGGQAR